MKDAQLTLGLRFEAQADFRDYAGSTNALVQAALEAWAAGEGPWSVGLWGAAAVGKSHLLQAAIRRAGEHGRSTMLLPLSELAGFGPRVLEGLEILQGLALDDVDGVAGVPAWEEALFDLCNRCQLTGCKLAYAMRAPPVVMPFGLPDLRSRLSSALIFQVQEPAEEEKPEVLRVMAGRRGMSLPEPVAAFLLSRLPRSLRDLAAALDTLDRLSLSRGRVLTIPFAREALDLRAD